MLALCWRLATLQPINHRNVRKEEPEKFRSVAQEQFQLLLWIFYSLQSSDGRQLVGNDSTFDLLFLDVIPDARGL